MSVAVSSLAAAASAAPAVESFPVRRPLHRLAAVRQQEGVSRRTVARHLGLTPSQVQQQEQEYTDLPLSALYAWQEALNVPVTELLVENGGELSMPVLRRAQLLRVMKTVRTILQRSKQVSVKRLAQTLADQLVEIMPELSQVGPWPAVGQRRTSRELGQAAQRRLSAEALFELERDYW